MLPWYTGVTLTNAFLKRMNCQHQLLQSATFEESDFVGDSWYVACLRWFRQYLALLEKNFKVFKRRPTYTAIWLALPSLCVLILLVGNRNSSSSSDSSFINQVPSDLTGLGKCDAFFFSSSSSSSSSSLSSSSATCLQVAYAPSTQWTDHVMKNVALLNDLKIGKDLKGFESAESLKTHVASNLGTVQFSVFFFQNESLWSLSNNSLPLVNPELTSSYVIYYNVTQGSADKRSAYHNVNFPLLALQKSIEHSMLKVDNPLQDVTYDANFAQAWSYSEGFTPTAVSQNSTCGDIKHDLFDVNVAAPLVFSFGFQFIGLLVFQILTEERHKGLLQSLRTLGLHFSSYWISYVTTTQILTLVSTSLALIIAAIIRPYTYVLQNLDFGVLFLLLWLGISCSVANAFCLASFTPSGNSVSVVVFMNFFICFLTLIFLIFNLNSYQWFFVTNPGGYEISCLLSPSTYNSVFDHRQGIEVAQFIVFWMPWFHIGRVISEILSVQQYGDFYHFQDIYDRKNMYYTTLTSTASFVPPSLSWTFGLMVLLTVVFVLFSWFFSQCAEGIPVESILLPVTFRKYIEGRNDPVIMGDYRGFERQKSEAEESIRAYKISKTYKSVQALKEVSFHIQKGEVFCLLGHNGAGKSTLFNILSGVTPTTHGNVYILGHDCNFEMMDIQQLIGICPQHDFLWDELTALEHMRLYACFKGLRLGPVLDAACFNVLSLVGLLDRSHTLAKNFSGGMKRRLSASMSVVGRVKVLYLDEPTTGLDPISRRAIWEMIGVMKKDRVVVLTTHNLEEADYLSDRIMILQNGQVKAIGNSLYLKQTYGTGYQVRMIVEPRVSGLVSNEIIKFLPRSTFSGGDASTGNIVVRIAKLDYIYFGRFLKWLEMLQRTPKYSEVIKEWGISNTTLEQVFLILSESSTALDTTQTHPTTTQESICPFCESNNKEAITFLPFPGNRVLMLPNAICQDCKGLPYFLIAEDEHKPLLSIDNDDERRVVTSQLFAKAQFNRTEALGNGSSESSPHEDAFSKALVETSTEENANVTIDSQLLLADNGAINTIEGPPGIHNDVPAAAAAPAANGNSPQRKGSIQNIVKAMLIKNIQLQLYQRCSTCCILITVLLILLVVFIIGLLWASTTTCPQGNTVDSFAGESCDIPYQSQYLFTVQDDTSLQYQITHHSDFNISFEVYLSPRFPYPPDFTVVEGEFASTIGFANLGIPDYPYRRGTVWASNTETSSEKYSSQQSLFYPMENGSDSSKWNEVMYANQRRIAESIAQEKNGCLFSPDVYINNTNMMQDTYGANFADAIFDCPTCQPSDNALYFRGNVWVTGVENTNQYPYVFINTDSYSYSFSTGVCPNMEAYFPSKVVPNINNPQDYRVNAYVINDTVQAMQFINVLSNSIKDPSGDSFTVQGGLSSYSTVFYNYGSSQFLVFLLTMLTVLLMNGILPMAVWRLSYERNRGLRTMMNSIGLKDPLYVFAMFAFDFSTMFVINLSVAILLVEAKLSYFANVPLGYLVALAFLSAYTMSGLAFAFVRFAPQSSRMTTLIATLINFAASIAASLVCIINYPDVSKGYWPSGLSIIPHFAQVRVLWVLLTIGKPNQEVAEGLGLLFVFGTACLGIEVLVSGWDILVRKSFDLMHIYMPPSVEQPLADQNRQDIESFLQDSGSSDIDEDVLNEKRLVRDLQASHSGEFAIIMKNLRQEFFLDDRKKALVAVDDLSLGLKYGEVFGLLGPNGAGKSTTLSILCGILSPTSGEVFIAGESIHSMNTTSFHSLIGICPQQDVCWENLTVAEHLGFQARLRGIEFNRVFAEVQRVAVKVGLDGDSFKSSAGTLSGGQRRRLSIGMSIVADPPIIFLDEPSAGLDPATRKGLWQLITALRQPNRCIVLTTHSMEEAETLCSRLGVIAKGQLRCIGPPLHLKKKFGTGYTIEMSLNANVTEASDGVASIARDVETNNVVEQDIDKFMLEDIAKNATPTASHLLISAINLTRKYMIPKSSNVSISDVFVKMESNKKRLQISQWSISETTLEDIFISLVTEPNNKNASYNAIAQNGEENTVE